MRGAPELLFALTPTLSRGERGILKEEIVIANNFITSANELAGYRIVRNLGIVRGIVVRSRSIVGTIGAGLQSLFVGDIRMTVTGRVTGPRSPSRTIFWRRGA